MGSEGGQGKLVPVAVSNIDNIPEGVDEDDNWKFGWAIGRQSVQRVDVKRKLLACKTPVGLR